MTKAAQNWLLTALLASALIPVVFQGDSWLGVMLTSMLLHLLVGYVVVSVLLFVQKRWLPFTASVVAAIVLFTMVPRFNSERPNLQSDAAILKVAHFNVFKLNERYDSVITAVLTEQPDVVSFQEVTFAWTEQLCSGLKQHYPYQYTLPHTGTRGLAVFSKTRIADNKWTFTEGMPNFSGSLCTAYGDVALLVTHVCNPIYFTEHGRRDRHLNVLATRMRSLEGPGLLIGDFNTVPWDEAFKRLCWKGGVADSRNSLMPTYLNFLPFAQIPIDYILHTDELQCHRFDVITNTGSDHHGIVGVYSMKPQEEAPQSLAAKRVAYP